MLLRAMLEPSTTKGRRIQGELKNLLEDAAVRRVESSASRRQGCPRSIAQQLPDSCGKPWSTPGARGTRHLQPQVASATSTIAATAEPVSTRRCAEATTPGVGDATTARRIGAPRPNHQVRKPSAGPYDGRRSRPGSEPRLPSPSTCNTHFVKKNLEREIILLYRYVCYLYSLFHVDISLTQKI
jgi:hypothetical protein